MSTFYLIIILLFHPLLINALLVYHLTFSNYSALISYLDHITKYLSLKGNHFNPVDFNNLINYYYYFINYYSYYYYFINYYLYYYYFINY